MASNVNPLEDSVKQQQLEQWLQNEQLEEEQISEQEHSDAVKEDDRIKAQTQELVDKGVQDANAAQVPVQNAGSPVVANKRFARHGRHKKV